MAGTQRTPGAAAPYYYVPHPSKWPIVGSIALVFFGFGMALWVNDWAVGPPLFAAFLAILVYMLIGWFRDVSRESEGGLYSQRIDTSYRWSMAWFIFSEVMFFAAFFGEDLLGGGGPRGRTSRGGDVQAVVEIDLEEAFTGLAVTVPADVAASCARCGATGAEPGTGSRSCPTCGGGGVVRRERARRGVARLPPLDGGAVESEDGLEGRAL